MSIKHGIGKRNEWGECQIDNKPTKDENTTYITPLESLQ